MISPGLPPSWGLINRALRGDPHAAKGWELSEIRAEELSQPEALHLLLPQAKHLNHSLLRLRVNMASQPTHWLFSASEPFF